MVNDYKRAEIGKKDAKYFFNGNQIGISVDEEEGKAKKRLKGEVEAIYSQIHQKVKQLLNSSNQENNIKSQLVTFHIMEAMCQGVHAGLTTPLFIQLQKCDSTPFLSSSDVVGYTSLDINDNRIKFKASIEQEAVTQEITENRFQSSPDTTSK
jgi:hypothetical protein